MAEAHMAGEDVKYSVDERGVATITLDRQDNSGNALTEDMLNAISSKFWDVKNNPRVKVVVLRSAKEKIFCAGVDLMEMMTAMSITDPKKRKEVNRRQSKALSLAFALIADCKKPVIGVANGKSSGAGSTLLRMCDWVVADQERASFAYPEVNFGMLPSISAYYVLPHILTQKDGLEKARKCFYEGQQMKALLGKEYGMFNELVSGAQLEDATHKAVEGALEGRLERWSIDKNKVPEYLKREKNYIEDPIIAKKEAAAERTIFRAIRQIMGTSGKKSHDFRNQCVDELTQTRCNPETLVVLKGYIDKLQERKRVMDTVIGGKDIADGERSAAR